MTQGFIRQSPHPANRETSRTSHTAHSRPLGPFSSGFTLMEILIAIAIFAIGLVAVASIFPAAILLQRETMDQVEAKHFSRSAQAEVAARGFVSSDWDDDNPQSGPDDNYDNENASSPNTYDGAKPLPSDVFDPTNVEAWSLFDRSYSALRTGDAQRVFWVPLIRDMDPRDDEYDWRVYLFVVRGRQTETYTNGGSTVANPSGDPNFVPRVKYSNVSGTTWTPPTNLDGDPAPDGVRVGDSVLGTDGVVYPVTNNSGVPRVNFPNNYPTGVWYAAPGTDNPDNGTFVRLITLIDDEDTNVVRQP